MSIANVETQIPRKNVSWTSHLILINIGAVYSPQLGNLLLDCRGPQQNTSVAALGLPYISALPSASSQEALYTKPRLLLMNIYETLSLSSEVWSLLIKSTLITHLLVLLPVYTLATLTAVLYPQTSRTLFEFALHTCSPCSVLAAWVATHFWRSPP